MSDKDKMPNTGSTGPCFIGITMGCPVGIGPEIILHFLAKRNRPKDYFPVVIGDIGMLQRCAEELQFKVKIRAWDPDQEVDSNTIYVIEPKPVEWYTLQSANLHWGKPDKETGRAALAYIAEAVRLIKKGVLDGMVTCPISKLAIQLAGCPFPGHTEMLAALCNTENFGMMMAGSSLKVSLVTIHKPLARVAAELQQSEIERVIHLTGDTLVSDFGMRNPRIAVAGFNPHSGEAGLFGREEQNVILPAVTGAASEKWKLEGPLPPDTVFKMAYDNRFDAVVAMYHDQGLIPFKLLHFEDGVNLTMGLPIVRTSVDHGTAYDIAGKGIASDASLKAAFVLAAEIIGNRKRGDKKPPLPGKADTMAG